MTEGFWNGLSSGFAPAYETSFKAALDAPLKQAQIDFYKQRGKIAGRAADYKYGPDGKPLQDAEGNLVPVDAPPSPSQVALPGPTPNQPPIQPPAMAALPTLGPPKLGQAAMPDNLVPVEQAKGTEQANGLGGPPVTPTAAPIGLPTLQPRPNVAPAVRDQMVRDAEKQKMLDARAAAAQAAALAKQEQGQQFKKANPVVGAGGLRGVTALLNFDKKLGSGNVDSTISASNAMKKLWQEGHNMDDSSFKAVAEQAGAKVPSISAFLQSKGNQPLNDNDRAAIYEKLKSTVVDEMNKFNGSTAAVSDAMFKNFAIGLPSWSDRSPAAGAAFDNWDNLIIKPNIEAPLRIYGPAKDNPNVRPFYEAHARLYRNLYGSEFDPNAVKLKSFSESAPQGPKPGDIEQGHRFKGGNPGDPNSWEAVQ